MGITKDGITGEKKLFALLRSKGFDFFQPDAIGIKNGTWYVFEAKNQEYYKAPPFDGHGLPLWQVKARLRFQKKTGVKCMLVIFEKGENIIYIQSLDYLESSQFHDTGGDKPRRIYPLERFKKLGPQHA